jgi:sugar transferase (PEP-CTERM/EpsH1 system associated)
LKLHVTHVVHWLRVAGLENGVVNLVNGLRSDLNQTIICLEDVGPLKERLAPHIQVVSLGKKYPRNLRVWELARIIRKLRPDIVHSRNWAGIDAVMAARISRVPVVIHGEHGREAIDPKGQNRRRKLIRRALSPFVDQYVTVSDDLRHWLVNGRIPEKKIIRIHNGVDTSRFSNGSRETARGLLGVSSDQVVIGTVGRLDPVKDHTTLIRAFAMVQPQHTRSVLIIVGEGLLRLALENQIEELRLGGQVRLIGERSDIPAILKAFDVFVLPSIAEGLSNTILEAMASELPVIATRTGGNPELVKDGVTGSLVPVQNPATLADAMEMYLKDSELRAAHGKAGRERVVRQFTVERMVAQYLSLYLSLSKRCK